MHQHIRASVINNCIIGLAKINRNRKCTSPQKRFNSRGKSKNQIIVPLKEIQNLIRKIKTKREYPTRHKTESNIGVNYQI